ncbi:hypothetical protein ABN034_31410 [Actinopolymorpha sp. B11F2]
MVELLPTGTRRFVDLVLEDSPCVRLERDKRPAVTEAPAVTTRPGLVRK